MSELTEIPETASDVTPGITEASAMLPTTNDTPSHKTTIGLASSRMEMMLHWSPPAVNSLRPYGPLH